jgi:hypothetical protein
MTSATVNKSFVALPWYGATVLVLEFSTAQNGDTLDLTTLDGGEGLKFVDGLLDFTTAGSIVATATASSCTSANGTTIAIGPTTASCQIVIIGR